MSVPEETKPRPWTVTVLLAWSLGGLLWEVLSGDPAPASWISAIGPPLALVVAFGAWAAKRWAFTLMLAATLFVVVIVFPATLFLESEPPSNLVVSMISIVGQLILLFHPATRAYATQHLAISRQPTSSPRIVQPESVGVRRNTIVALVFLLTAIAIAGTLGVIRIYQMGG